MLIRPQFVVDVRAAVCSSCGTAVLKLTTARRFLLYRLQEVSCGKVRPREVERLRPSGGSRAASDTDDALWEELLQGPDSASSGSSDTESSGRFNAGVPLPQTTTLSSDDDDESLQQGITGVRSA